MCPGAPLTAGAPLSSCRIWIHTVEMNVKLISREQKILPRWLSAQEPSCQCKRPRSLRFDPWVGRIPWRRKWQPTPVFLPGKFHGQRSLAGCSPRGRKESDTTERGSMYMHTQGGRSRKPYQRAEARRLSRAPSADQRCEEGKSRNLVLIHHLL